MAKTKTTKTVAQEPQFRSGGHLFATTPYAHTVVGQ